MTQRRFLVPALLLAASLAAAAVGAAHERQQETDSRGVLMSIARAPAKARDWKNPYEGNPDAVLAGQKLYRQHCAECHGDNARGKRNAVNLRSPGVQNATPGELVWMLWNGNLFHGMPSWSGLPVQRRWQIVTYLKSLGPHDTSTNGTNDPSGTSSGAAQ